ncbi:uncharacterized protein MONBRDRAFT_32020 [Monosiga brevicollis MX1]|uniref:C2 domain-containing protein n=1 Tax=Monosiga brevicollis TaxID=81824 RepID=A9UWW5_MONBE|nr:uncharacterized protein MONBRDRAFT_32020 [Monosiga brevicollis MX1]EDQ90113.1 predicted protein [Monosiga brevicollis MX1]|eukprot:XP_001744880.1 hypothetical protein [Monosiga brevicollis MX1]
MLVQEQDYRRHFEADELALSLLHTLRLGTARQLPQSKLTYKECISSTFEIPLSSIAHLYEQVHESPSPTRLNHRVDILALDVSNIPQSLQDVGGTVRCVFEVVAPTKTAKHKRQARSLVRRDFMYQTDDQAIKPKHHWDLATKVQTIEPDKCSLQIEVWHVDSTLIHEVEEELEEDADEANSVLDDKTFDCLDNNFKAKNKKLNASKVIMRRLRTLKKHTSALLSRSSRGLDSLASSASEASLSLSRASRLGHSEEPEIGGPGLTLIGRAFLELDTLSEQPSDQVLRLHTLNKKLDMKVSVMACLKPVGETELTTSIRLKHRCITQRILVKAGVQHKAKLDEAVACEDMTASEASNVPWDGHLDTPSIELLKTHADSLGVPKHLALLDYFCILMELHGQLPVEIEAICKAFVRKAPEDIILEENDLDRLVGAAQALYCFSRDAVAWPFDRDEEQFDAYLYHLRALVAVFQVEPWHSTMDVSTQAIEAKVNASASTATILQYVRDYVRSRPNFTYVAIRKRVAEQFGDEAMEEAADAIQELLKECLQAPDSTSPSTVDSPLYTRLIELLQQSSAPELISSHIQDKLMKEFDVDEVNRSRKTIDTAVLHELSRRRANHGVTTSGKLELKPELRHAITESAKKRLSILRELSTREDDGDDAKLLAVIRFIKAATIDLRNLKQREAAIQAIIPSFSPFECVLQVFDGPIMEQVCAALRAHHAERDLKDLSTLVFTLYDALRQARDLWCDLPEDLLPKLKLPRYYSEFAVVVQRWLRLSKDKGQTWVDNSVAADNFEADAGQQFSASAIDVFRAFQEIVEMWDWIAWPDEENAEEVLFVSLADSVFHCIGYYSDRLCQRVTEMEQQRLAAEPNQPYVFSHVICMAMNNLMQAKKYFSVVHATLALTDVAERHRQRALEYNKNHSGQIKPHRAVAFHDEAKAKLTSGIDLLVDFGSKQIISVLKPELFRIALECYQQEIASDDFVEQKLYYYLCEPDDAAGRVEPDRETTPAVFDRTMGSTRVKQMSNKLRKKACFLLNDLIKKTAKVHVPAGYLCRNLMVMIEELNQDDQVTVDSILSRLFIQIMTCLREIILDEQNILDKTSTNSMSRFALAARRTLVNFFYQEGDGVQLDLLEDVCAEQLDPILTFIRSSSDELIDEFYRQGAATQATCIRASYLHDARVALLQNRSVIGNLAIEVIVFPNNDLQVSIVQGFGISLARTYVVLRLLPGPFDGKEFKAKTGVCRSTPPMYNTVVEIPVQQYPRGRVLQLRLQTPNHMRDDDVHGEALLSLAELRRACRNFEVGTAMKLDVPLRSIQYEGETGWLQKVIEARHRTLPDESSDWFMRKYVRRFVESQSEA